jgi:hypothetical protein
MRKALGNDKSLQRVEPDYRNQLIDGVDIDGDYEDIFDSFLTFFQQLFAFDGNDEDGTEICRLAFTRVIQSSPNCKDSRHCRLRQRTKV